ncbi:Phage integrase family protein [Allorhodopirellula heiligendammensis]|uniref:Phage integrase family protein n=2 Tax=Allorhodopirellula heiligendammensis TaxID=2714739 RepID=A0A5C6BWI2_9BACT|nr:Phage integrase family protein [Allorhodopirellula heiligendammensis]
MNDAGEAMDEIEDVIGFIDPSEPDVIQNLRRAIRGRQDTPEAERVYVSNVKAFMRERGLRRHHMHKDTFPANLREAVKKAGIHKHINSHVFRHILLHICGMREKLLSETN